MLNYIWFGLMAIALIVAAINGTADAVTRGAVESASSAVQIAFGLVGIMTLWLGMMRVAEAAGLVSWVGHALRPLLWWRPLAHLFSPRNRSPRRTSTSR